MLTTPESIRTLQRKLYRKAKQEPAYRFYALYDKVYRADILSHAYRLVRANKGSAGIDGVTFEAIERAEGETAFVAELQEALKSKSYASSPVKRVMIPKADGSKRPLGIPTIRDRVAQMAVKLVIEPIFEADFCDSSYGFRPKKSAHDAVNDIGYALNCGYTKVIDADVSKYFDSIPHAKLMAVLAERIVDGAMLHIIRMWLKAPVAGEDEDGTRRNIGGGKANTEGTPQGGVISPLPVVMKKVNQALVGWVGYFHYRNCSRSLEQLKGHAEQRVRTHLCKRHKIRSRWEGCYRFPNRLLYETYGLFKVPTTAGWTRAHALR